MGLCASMGISESGAIAKYGKICIGVFSACKPQKCLRLDTDPANFAKDCFGQVMKQDLVGVAAHCFRHGKMCSVSRTRSGTDAAESDKDALNLHVAGFNCFDWSLMGGRKGLVWTEHACIYAMVSRANAV